MLMMYLFIGGVIGLPILVVIIIWSDCAHAAKVERDQPMLAEHRKNKTGPYKPIPATRGLTHCPICWDKNVQTELGTHQKIKTEVLFFTSLYHIGRVVVPGLARWTTPLVPDLRRWDKVCPKCGWKQEGK